MGSDGATQNRGVRVCLLLFLHIHLPRPTEPKMMMQSPLNYVTLATTPPPSSCRRLPYRAVVKLRGHLKPLGQQSVVPSKLAQSSQHPIFYPYFLVSPSIYKYIYICLLFSPFLLPTLFTAFWMNPPRLPLPWLFFSRGCGVLALLAGEVEVVESFPDPETFYRNYVHPRRPVLFRRAQQHAPALKLWSQDSYLKVSQYTAQQHCWLATLPSMM